MPNEMPLNATAATAEAAASATAMAAPREIPNNKTGLPLAHYREKFAAADPAVMAARSGIAYSAQRRAFTFHFLKRPIEILWPSMDVRYVEVAHAEAPEAFPAAPAPALSDYAQILLSRLVIERQLVPTAGKFKAYAEMPWGQEYLGAFHGRCIMRLTYRFRNGEAFAAACEAAGGVRVDESANQAFEFEFIDGLFVRLLYWERDDEFPPAAQILFSDNFELAFTAEDMAVVGDLLIGALPRTR